MPCLNTWRQAQTELRDSPPYKKMDEYPMIKERSLIAVLLCASIAPAAYADLPLTIEELLTAEKRWRADVGIVYANSDRRNVDSRFNTIQIGPGQYISVPVVVGQARQNMDLFALSSSVRYGLSLDTELYGRLGAVAQSVRTLDADGPASDSSEKFSDGWIGVNHRLANDADTPALLAFIELAVDENVAAEGNELAHGKSAMIGLTTYRATDPLVLSLTTGYRYNAMRDVGGQRIDPGDLLFINPSIGFAVNHEVTLTSGLQWRWQQRDEVDGQYLGIRTTKTQLELGMGYAWSKQLTLQVNSRSDVTGDGGAEIGVTFLYKFPSRFLFNDKQKGGEGTEEAQQHNTGS